MKRLLRLMWCEHEDIRHVTADRLWMECLKCGRETEVFASSNVRHKRVGGSIWPFNLRVQSARLTTMLRDDLCVETRQQEL